MSFGVRELRESDRVEIENLVDRGDLYKTVLLIGAVKGFETFPGWWYGSLRDGRKLESMMSIHDRRAVLYSESNDTLEAMATHMRKEQEYITNAASHRHTIIGPKAIIDPFWSIFRELGRQLVSDSQSTLMASTGEGTCPSKRIAMAFGKEEDLGLITEFEALRILEETGKDPRRGGGVAHSHQCALALREGRQVIGREGSKPAFVAQLRVVAPNKVLLDHVYVPNSFRTRKRLIGSALFKLKYAPPVRDKELLFFADSETLQIAAETAGYVATIPYRKVVTVG